MAKNQVTLTFAGDSKSLEKAFDRAGQGARDMADDFDKAAADAKTMGSRVDAAGSAVGNQESKFMGTADVLDGLASAFGLNVDRQIELARAAGDIAGGIENLKGSISSGIDAVGKMGDKFSDAAKMAVKAKIETVKTAAAQGVAWVKSSAQAMASAIKVRAAWLISMGPIALVVAAVAGAVFLIVKYWDEIKAAASKVWEWVSGVFGDLKDFFVRWAPLMLGPIGLVIKEWDKLKAGAAAVWEGIKAGWDAIAGVPAAILAFIRDGVTTALEGLGKAGAVVAQAVWSGIKAAWDGVTGVAGAIGGFIRDGVTGALDGLGQAGAVAAQAVWNGIKAAWDGITSISEKVAGWIGDGIRGAVESVKTHAGKLGGAVWDGIKATWNGLKAGITAAIVDPFKSAWNWVANKLNAFKIPSLKIAGVTITPSVDPIPHVPTFHSGGTFHAASAGGEGLALLKDGERVLAPGQRAGSTVIFQAGAIQALDPQAAASAVVRAIEEYERRNGQRFARA